jgi:CubicO group peptidase (beta-lactamase class C family)
MHDTSPDAALAARLDAAIARAIDEKRIVGTVIIVLRDGARVYRRAAGLADREAATPMRPDQIFRLASITKPIVTAAAMRLVEEGKLSLEAAITEWLPDFRPRLADGRAPVITVRHLLTHTAGLGYGFLESADGPYHRAGISDGLDQTGLSMAEELRRLGSVPLLYEPGVAWGYSLALDVLGAIIARIGGATLPDMVERLVTTPLGMRDTAFRITETARLAAAYADGKPDPVRMGDPYVVPFGEGAGIPFSPSRIFDRMAFPSGGGGMAGTADDIALFLETVRSGGGTILMPETTRAMMANQIGALRVTTRPIPAWGFGFGGAVLLDPAMAGVPHSLGTWSWGGVYGHHWFVDPAKRITLVTLTNTAVEGMTGAFVGEVANAVYGTS